MKVLIVDDEAPARDRLIHMVSSIDGMETSGQASNGLEAVRWCKTLIQMWFLWTSVCQVWTASKPHAT